MEYVDGFIANDKNPKRLKLETQCSARKWKINNLIAQIFLCAEILEVIFKSSDIGRLKKFRLVCKAWNKEICLSVGREIWVAAVSYDKPLTMLQEMIEGRRNTQLPLPFDKIDMLAQRTIVRGSYLWLGAYDLQITKLNLLEVSPKYGGVSWMSADFLLQAYSGTLTHLTIPYWTSSIKEPLYFPRLQLLGICFGGGDSLPHFTSFFLKIISAAPKLKSLRIGCVILTIGILKEADLRRLKHLEIATNARALSVAQSPGLESLNNLSIFTSWGFADNLNELREALSPFSARLKILKIRDTQGCPAGVLPSNFLLFSLLTTLQLEHYSPGGLDFSCFPSLKHLILLHVRLNANGISSSAPSRSLSVQTVSVRLSVATHIGEIYWRSRELAPTAVQQRVFADMFLNFPNAQAWELPSGNAVSFCRALCLIYIAVHVLACSLYQSSY